MRSSVQKKNEQGKSVYIIPDLFQKCANFQSVNGVEPKNTILDNRNEEQKEHAVSNVIPTSLNEEIQPYSRPVTHKVSVKMGDATVPSLYHSKALKLILYLLRDPDNV